MRMRDDLRLERRRILDGAWPHFPILPVVNLKDRRTGLIAWVYVAPPAQDRPVRVYLANIFELGIEAKEKGRPVTWKEALEGAETVEYPTLAAFFEAGWRAD